MELKFDPSLYPSDGFKIVCLPSYSQDENTATLFMNPSDYERLRKQQEKQLKLNNNA